jgi:tRNA(Leu) C34 or U34 (ribose-2'-O)-methylase TrmL
MKLQSAVIPLSKLLLLVPSTATAFHRPLNSYHHVIASRTVMVMDHSISSGTKSTNMEDDTSNIRDNAANQVGSPPFVKTTNEHRPSPLAGIPIGPVLVSQYRSPTSQNIGSDADQPIIIRYMYEGGHPSQGRLCHLHPDSNVITVPQLISKLIQDGVDMDSFYACAYETLLSSGGWMPLEKGKRWHNPFDIEGCWKDEADDVEMIFPLRSSGVGADGTLDSCAKRIDIKLFRRPKVPAQNDVSNIDGGEENPFNSVISSQPSSQNSIEHSLDALQAIQCAVPSGKLPIQGYFGIGIIQPKTSSNIGTLLRSAYQLGASLVYTIGVRYKSSSTDTLNVPARIPLIEVNDWNTFVENSPRSAVWVVIEMGGTPLREFVHPRNAIYILGSEDHGVPTNVLRACREVVSLEAQEYSSYNVAVAGSIVMYDRLTKMREF